MATLIWKHAVNCIVKLKDDNETEDSVDVEEIIGQGDDDTAELGPVFKPDVERIRSHTPDDATKLKMMYEGNVLFTSWSTKRFSLMP
jgi:hypothetical protein